MDLISLKAQMGQLGSVAKELKAKENTGYEADPRIFKPTKDSAGNISCIIRFLPQLDFSKSPYVEKFGHFIKASGKTFVCDCLNNGAKKGDCPSCTEARPFWDDYWAVRNAHGKEHPDCEAARISANRFTAKTQVLTNILVVQNPADTESEGKVFLYSMPKVVVEKYKQKLFPKDEMDEMVVIYHPLEGRNFKLDGFTKVVNEENQFLQYDNSYFYDKTTPISDDENRIVQVMNETFNLSDYLAESKPNKDDIIKRFNEFKKFLGMKTEDKKKDVVVKKEEVVEEDVNVDEIEEISADEIDSLFD